MEPVFQAKSEYYFGSSDCPIAVMRVAAGNSIQHPHDLTCDPHWHDFAELVIVARGNGIQVIDDEEYAVGQGDVFLLQGRCAHYFLERNTVTLVNVAFAPERLPLPFDWLRRLPGYNVIFELEPSVRTASTFKHRLKLDGTGLEHALQLISELEQQLLECKPGYEVAAFQKLLELIVFVSRVYDAPRPENQAAVMRVGKIISLLERDFSRDWTLNELARRAATSPNNLLRYFNTVTGTSPIDYLIRVRLKRAAEMLKSRSISIAEIAAECGFGDSNYFTRKFRAVYGLSPRDFKKTP